MKVLTDGDVSSNFTFNTNYGSGGYSDAAKSKTETVDMTVNRMKMLANVAS